jgi:hypothetical protein
MPDSTLLAADRDRRFADWARPVTDVTGTFDPITRVIAESNSDTPLEAIVTPVDEKPIGTTAGHARLAEIAFQFKTEKLPPLGTATERRVVFENCEYRVVRHDHHAAAQIDTLSCTRVV